MGRIVFFPKSCTLPVLKAQRQKKLGTCETRLVSPESGSVSGIPNAHWANASSKRPNRFSAFCSAFVLRNLKGNSKMVALNIACCYARSSVYTEYIRKHVFSILNNSVIDSAIFISLVCIFFCSSASHNKFII